MDNQKIILPFALIFTVLVGIFPALLALFLLKTGDMSPLVATPAILLCLMFLASCYGIWKKQIWGKHLFTVAIVSYFLLNGGDQIVRIMDGEANNQIYFRLIKAIGIPIFTIWLLYFSNAKNYFSAKA